MKKELKTTPIAFPLNFGEFDGRASVISIKPTPDGFDDLIIVPNQPAKVYAPHDGLLQDRPAIKDIIIIAKNGKYGSALAEFVLDAKYLGATNEKPIEVKRGDVIGTTAVSPGILKWSGLLLTKEVGDIKETKFIQVNPLILAGALGGLEYPGILNQEGYVDDVKKALTDLTSTIGKYALAFGAGWVVGKL